MNEDRIDALLRGHVPAIDEAAEERARRRLRAAIDRELAPVRDRGGKIVWAVAVAALVSVLVGLQILLPPGPGGPARGAAEEIRRLGQISRAQPVVVAGRSDYFYRRYEQLGVEAGGSSESEYNLSVRVSVESWLRSDGSGARATTYKQVGFVSSLDRENWLQEGGPIPATGDVKTERFQEGGLSVYPVEDLPSDPNALRRVIDGGSVITPGEGSAGLLSTIGLLLAQQDLSPDLRQGLFEVAATIPDVSVQADALDPIGRIAEAVIATDASGDFTLYFDPSDARILGWSSDHLAYQGHPAYTEWVVYLDADVVRRIPRPL